MKNQIRKDSAQLKQAFRAKVEKHGPEFWDTIRLSLARDLFEDVQEDYLHLAGRALLESGASHENSSRLIAKHWRIDVRDAETIVREAQASNDREKKLNSEPKATKKKTQSR